MHILLVHQAFAALDEAGGTRHIEFARYLAEKGHQVTIICSPVSYLTGRIRGERVNFLERTQEEAGVTILRTYTYPALHKTFIHRVYSFISFMISSFLVGLSVKHVDLVWGTSPPIFQGITAWLLARLRGVPFLFEVRDLWPAFAIAVGVLNNPVLVKASLWLEGFLYKHADRVVVNSPGYINHVREKGAKKVDLVANSADVDMFSPDGDGSEFRLQNHLNHHFVVLYAGAHGLSNDLDIVVDAAYQLRENDNIRFVLVGDGKEKKRIQAYAAEKDLHNILFLPAVPKNEIAKVFCGADACLAILKPIELYKTTYPNKVFDYMAAGKPVILAIDGVIREVVDQAGAGKFSTPGDPMSLANVVLEMSENPDLARQMGIAGRKYVEKYFNRKMTAGQLLEVLVDTRRKNG
jgi:glycosyltransferase involved in cell wall biosynthesis